MNRREHLDSIYVTYWSLRDPLCQSQSLPYLRWLAAAGRRIGVVTFEQDHWRLSRHEARRESDRLRADGLVWIPLRYHKRPSVLSTAADALIGVAAVVKVARTTGARIVHGRSTVAGGIGLLSSRIVGARFFYDADGPLSQEYAEAQLWDKRLIVFRVVRALEHACFRHADQAAVLTHTRRKQVQPLCRKPVVVLPCAVDTERFRLSDPLARKSARARLGLDGLIVAYVGKHGGPYGTDALFALLRSLKLARRVSLLVMTPSDPASFICDADRLGIPCRAEYTPPRDVPERLAAADIGVCFMARTPSLDGRSPIKIGEYLAVGLPVVISEGIGDYSRHVREANCGTVVDLQRPDWDAAAAHILALHDRPGIASACRALAVAELGLREQVGPRYERVYRSLGSEPGSAERQNAVQK